MNDINWTKKELFGGNVFFFKRELKEDQYFYLEQRGIKKHYVLPFNKDNFDPSLTETGKFSDSFKISLDKCQEMSLSSDLLDRRTKNEKILQYIKEIEERITKIKEEL